MIEIKSKLKFNKIGLSFIILFVTLASFTSWSFDNKQNGNKTQKQITKPTKDTTNSTKNTELHKGKINLNKLPNCIGEFVKKYFQGYKIKNAAYDPMCTGEDAIDVSIRKKGGPDYSLIFLPNGTFVQREEDIELNKAPTKVLEMVKIKFPGYKIGHQIERLTLADHSTQYLLDISMNNISKEVIFDIDGIIICEN
ncbi:MAG: hypothetical protein M1419_06020 [Bacteroidetes bacterium]|nr:hypothetical protein [Bacteroidota bacterium]